MLPQVFVKPAPGARVRDPVTRELLPEAGAPVPLNAFWRRRLEDGDVVRTDPRRGKKE